MNRSDESKPLRSLPAIDRVLRTAEAGALRARWLGRLVDAEVRAAVDEAREAIRAGRPPPAPPTPEGLAALAARRLEERFPRGVVRCVNATGVVLHTGLGRAVLPPSAAAALARELAGYSIVSVDREDGERIRRETACARILCALTGAEAATVVNNNAAATLLALQTAASGREAILSRGELVEIGGSFRMPEVFRAAGVRLREVGTTNRTHLSDYEAAIGPETGLLLRVHPSNFKVIGFTSAVGIEDLVALGRARNVPVMDDLGAGALLPVPPEPEIAASLRAGADLVCCSGDKLIGGPQSGLLLGSKSWIDRVRRNPLFRALRVDKMTLLALEETLRLFLRASGPGEDHPTLRMLGLPADRLERAARNLRARIARALPALETEVRPGQSQVGSGSLPGESLPTTLVALRKPGTSATAFARALRRGNPPVYPRIVEDWVCLDPRTLLDGDDRLLLEALKGIA